MAPHARARRARQRTSRPTHERKNAESRGRPGLRVPEGDLEPGPRAALDCDGEPGPVACRDRGPGSADHLPFFFAGGGAALPGFLPFFFGSSSSGSFGGGASSFFAAG